MTPNKSQIKARIEELEVMLADATPEQIAKSKADSVRMSEILDELKDWKAVKKIHWLKNLRRWILP